MICSAFLHAISITSTGAVDYLPWPLEAIFFARCLHIIFLAFSTTSVASLSVFFTKREFVQYKKHFSLHIYMHMYYLWLDTMPRAFLRNVKRNSRKRRHMVRRQTTSDATPKQGKISFRTIS